jgi:flagellar protein FliL
MADADMQQEDAPALKRSKLPLILGLVLALAGAGGGFYATWSGLLFADRTATGSTSVSPLPDVAYVPLDPLVINLPSGSRSRHLRFVAQLEVAAPHESEVSRMKPRVLDLLNGYLRAIDPAEFEDTAALVRLRAQMLRRIQMVTGDGRVRDLLVTEFVLN